MTQLFKGKFFSCSASPLGPVGLALLLSLLSIGYASASLATLKFHVVGAELRVSPLAVSVPKGIAGSVLVELVGGGSSNGAASALAEGAYVEAVLHGPSFDARRIVGPANGALVLPPLNLVGSYQLDNIRLVDAVTGAVRLEGTPASVPIRVFDEVLVSRVTSRPLTYEEVREKGIVIDEQNFRAVEFEVGFVLDGKSIPVKFPVVAPSFKQTTEVIPKAELQAALAEASVINQQIAATVELPPELQTSQINFDIVPVNFQRVEEVDIDLNLKVPPIPALVVIPGNIGFLNQFFSVQIFTENAAPGGSGLSVHNVKAELVLPPGPDLTRSTHYSQPGDDPLRFARVGTNGTLQTLASIVRPGVDGKVGTPDDIDRLYPGEQGQGEFLVEGLQEGLHVMDLNLTADLDGLAAGTVKITGKAAGSVLVRNPKFSLAFTHPRTVRSGEPYEASATILNTSTVDANQVSVTLAGASLSGGVLESEETVLLGNIAPGQTATATWRVRAQRTGAISFSNLTASDNSVQGRFRLRMGIDERGVALSPDTLAMPDFTTNLPPAVLSAANRVLGQALSVATAGQLPVGVSGVPKGIITKRVLELAEAGQRLAYGDTANRVLVDLMLDWQGARNSQPGFDEILRLTNAGREWREAVMAELERGDALEGVARLVKGVPDLAGRGEGWKLAASSRTEMEVSLYGGELAANFERSGIPQASAYPGARGGWVFAAPVTNCVFQWRAATNLTGVELVAVLSGTNGIARQLRWTLASVAAGALYRLPFTDTTGTLLADTNADGTVDALLAATILEVRELPPEVLAVRQDMSVKSGRPKAPCDNPEPGNYGTVVAVLFSKPMQANQVGQASAYRLDNGVTAGSVQIQPGGRVALANVRQPISAIVPRQLTVTGIADPRGNTIRLATLPVASDNYDGTTVRGRVVRADGTPAVAVPVTLTMYEGDNSGFETCKPTTIRVCQAFTDEAGRFTIDYVLAGVPYSVSATDTSGLTPDAISAILEASVDDQVQRARLEALANSDQYRDTLLGAFATAVLPEAIARAEGLDRAVLRDLIPLGSSRIGSETPIALRFRGKGTVTGRVLAADGSTPIPGAAVNLYPDPGSRQQPRGVFADSNGRFAFQGVPLGVFTIDARNSTGLYRIIAGELLEINAAKNFPIVLAGAVVTYTEIRGRVYESDGETPHGRGRVFIGKYENGAFGGVVGIATTDPDGWWSVTNVPSGAYDVVTTSFDGKRKGERRDVDAVGGASHFVTLLLQGTAIVAGKVEYANGQAAGNALVAGGTALVRTDANGLFTLQGVPTGPRTLSAGIERNTNAGIFFPRIGSASLNVVPGAANSVVIRLPSAGRIVGHVYDATGTNPVPNVRVVIPSGGGFQWVNADARGYYSFENMAPGGYTLSAPGPGVFNTDTSGLVSKIKQGTEEDVIEAITEAFAIFTGASDPYLNGSGLTFNPLTWGYTGTQIRFDGETAVADIKFLRQGTISGKVVNDQGVPIGARVRLTGVGPNTAGNPTTIIRGERNSDPALGTFEFPLSVFEGAWTLQVASPFYPDVLTLSGVSIPPNRLNATNLLLKFPAVSEVNGRLVGTVLNPDGTPADAGVKVRIKSMDLVIETRTNGFYDTQIALPGKKSYFVEVEDLVRGGRGAGGVYIVPGITNTCNVQLLGKGAVEILVQFADGTPAPGASVMVEQGSYPYDRCTGIADRRGRLLCQNLLEGAYAICTSESTGIARIMGRSGVTVTRDIVRSVVVRLAPTATIQGRFVLRDGVTGVDAAQVAIGNIGYAITDTNGFFSVEGVPLGTYRLLTQNPVNGVGAKTFVTLNYDGQTNSVTLLEQSRGEIRGYVLNSYASGYVPGALVTLSVQDELTPSRSVTTGPDGAYSFPGTPAAPLTVSATDPVNHRSGSKSAVLADNVASLQVDVQIEPLARLGGTVYHPDGVTPAANATVTLTGPGLSRRADTDTNGHVAFVDVPLGSYQILARDLRPDKSRSVGQSSVSLDRLGDAPDFRVRLLGVGSVSGTVVLSDGLTPIGGAVATLVSQTPLFYGVQQTVFTDFNGRFTFDNVPNGTYCLLAEFLVLGVNFTSAITNANQTDFVTLPLGSSGTVNGQLVRADGITPVAGVDVLLTFRSQSTIAGYALARTAANGAFTLPLIPLGDFTLEVNAPLVKGIARLKSQVSYNLQTADLGKVVLDEADPFVVSTFPADGAGNVHVATTPQILFSEALDPASMNMLSIYFCSGAGIMIPATPTLLETNGVKRLVRLVTSELLDSQSSYDVVVLHKPYRGGRVPTDLVGRPLAAPFLFHFTTADNRQPEVVSVFPSNNAVQIDPRSVMRVSFNEPVQPNGFTFSLSGPGGPVPGTASVGFNGLVVAFAPASPLLVNTRYTVGFSGARDLSGNLMLTHASASFDTLDTIGPDVATLRIADNRVPVAGGSIPVEALLVANEPSVTVRFTQDFQPAGLAAVSPYRVNVTLPATGSTTVRAYASDRYGNEGLFKELVITAVSNQPPLVQLARVTPLTGTVGTSNTLVLRVGAVDDYTVTNLTLVGAGAFGFVTNFSSGATQLVSIAIPPGVVPPAQFQVSAQALDGLGVASEVGALSVDLSDGTPPAVTINSPAADTVLNPAQPFTLSLSAVDNSTNMVLDVILSGALSATQTTNVLVVTNHPIALVYNVPLVDALTNGTPLTATIRAQDASGNRSSIRRDFRLPDREPPRLISVTPSNGAPNQSLWLDTVVFKFTEAIASDSVSSNLFVFTNAPPTPYTVTTGAAPQIVLLRPTTLPLQPGTSYTHLIRPGVSDTAGNGLVDTNGLPLTSEGVSFRFTTANILDVQPTHSAPIVPGQAIGVSVAFEAGLGANSFSFAFGSNPPVDVAVSGETINAAAVLRLPTNATSAVLNVAARKTGQPAYALAPVVLSLRPRGGDDDGDGLLNGFEADRGMNPFVADLDADDFDGDGLTNGDERTRGTDPGKSDTDGDGLSDGAEIVAGTNPLNPDSDGDGLLDGIDPSPLKGDSAPVLELLSALEITEGVVTNLSVTVTDVDANVRQLQVFAAAGESNRWQVLRWRQSSNAVFAINTNAGFLAGTLDLKNLQPGTSTVQVVAQDVTHLRRTNLLTVVVLGDADHDGIPDRDDSDMDGDGLSNDQEIALGTNVRNDDTDGDGIADGVDPRPLIANIPPIAESLDGLWAARFDGIDDALEVTSAPGLNFGVGDFSVELWLRLQSGAYAANQEMGLVNRNAFFQGTPGWGVEVSTYGEFPRFGVSFYNTGQPAWCSTCGSVGSLAPDTWYHFAAVRSGPTNRVYLNGELAAVRVDAAGALNVNNNLPLVFGKHSWGPNFPGQLDEVRLWNTALSAEQIRGNFRRRSSGGEVGLVGYWRFDATNGSSFADLTANTLSASPVGGTATRMPQLVQSSAGIVASRASPVGSTDIVVALGGRDADNDPLTASITALPAHGRLYQTADGVTLGLEITSVPTLVTDPGRRVIHHRAAGFTGLDQFRYRVNDGYTNSATEAYVSLDLYTPPDFDGDGDGLVDVYELLHGLNPELNDAGEDPDRDGLSSLQEYLDGTLPDNPDTDNDGLSDGAELAAGSDPLNRDTDGDGLPDGQDPQPMRIVGGLNIIARNDVTLFVGGTTNLNVLGLSSNAPVVLLDAWPTNPLPTFASLGSIQFTNTPTNGAAFATLSLNPLHDAAGEYVISMRCAAKDGKSGLWNIHVSVLPDPTYYVTRWLSPVSGNWNDATKWSAGVPTANSFAVIDVPGSSAYTVTMNVQPNCRGWVIDSANLNLSLPSPLTLNMATELRHGRMDLPVNIGITVNRSFYNGGSVRLASKSYYSQDRIVGSGRVENSGLIEFYVAGSDGGYGGIRVPVNVGVNGRFSVPSGTYCYLAGGVTATVAGILDVRGLMVVQDDETTVRVVAGGQITGGGSLRFHSASRLNLAGDAMMGAHLELYDTARATGPGTLTLAGNQTLTGTYDCPVVVGSGAHVDMQMPAFNGAVVVAVGGVAQLPVNYGMTLNGVLTNYGSVRLASKSYYSQDRIVGRGRVENSGLIEFYVAGSDGGYGGIRVPVNVGVNGRFSVPSGTYCYLAGGVTATVAGILDVRGLMMVQNDETTVRVVAGGQITGGGSLQFYSASRLNLVGDAMMGAHLELYDTARATGPGTLTLAGNQTLTGTYECPVVVGSGAHVDMQMPTFNGAVVVAAGGVAQLPVNYGMTLNGVLTNYGSVRLASKSYYSQDRIVGRGRVENSGLIEFYVAGSDGGYGGIRVPVNVGVNGRFSVPSGTYCYLAGGVTATVAGILDVRGLMMVQNDETTVRVVAGGQITGGGSLQFYSASRLNLVGDAMMGAHLELYDTAKATGPGTLTLAGNQTLTGTYECPVTIAQSGWSDIRNALFTTNLMVLSNAVLNIPGSYSMRLDQVLTNHGTVQMTSRDVNTSITTAAGGCIVNHGLLQVLAQGAGGGSASIYVPLFVTPPGRLLVGTNALFVLGDGGAMAVSGKIEVQSGGLLRVDPAPFPRDFILFAGAEFLGIGEVRLSGSHRLLVLGDATLSGGLFAMTGTTTARGYGRLTVGPNATFSVDHSLSLPGSLSVSGSVRVQGSGTVLSIGGVLTLNTEGTISNDGTIKAGSFVNLGGKIIGHTPVGNGSVGGPPALANLVSPSQIRISSNSPAPPDGAGASDFVMNWLALPASECVIETSTDLIQWSHCGATIAEPVPGYYQARIQALSRGRAFFRVRTR